MQKINSNQSKALIDGQNLKNYLEIHNIILDRSTSGITYVGVSRKVTDGHESQILFTFPSGSYNDSKLKSGIHHLLEHLILNLIMNKADSHDVYENAYTSYKQIQIEVTGVSNSKHKNYGLWPQISHICSILKNIEKAPNMKNLINNEIKTVLAEKAERDADMKRLHVKYVYECLYDKSNPLRTEGLGNNQSLSMIKPKDIYDLTNKIFIPQGLIVGVFSEGTSKDCQQIIEEIKNNLSDFAGTGISPLTIPYEITEKLNPEFKPGVLFAKDDGLKNGLISVSFTWVFPSVDLSSHSFAFGRLVPIINDKLFKYLRSLGISYSSNAHDVDSKNLKVIFVELTIPKNKEVIENIKHLYKDIKEAVFEKIDDSQLNLVNEKEKTIQEAVPLPARSRFNYLIYGLENYGKVVDADIIKDMYKKVTIEDLKDWRDKFINTEPAIIITGDLD